MNNWIVLPKLAGSRYDLGHAIGTWIPLRLYAVGRGVGLVGTQFWVAGRLKCTLDQFTKHHTIPQFYNYMNKILKKKPKKRWPVKKQNIYRHIDRYINIYLNSTNSVMLKACDKYKV